MNEEKKTQNQAEFYVPDVLGNGFEKRTLALTDDYEGTVIATVIRRKSVFKSKKAVLYIHGFNDYFFQEIMAQQFNQQGFHFYALDLRKYGRSYLKHQKLNNVRSILEYDEEIKRVLQIIKSEDNDQILLKGHSTGGLIVTNYAVNHLNSAYFNGVICNSPFYDFNLPIVLRELGIPIISFLGKYFPNLRISVKFSKVYGHSLHEDEQGEWNYFLYWKPHQIPKVNLGFIRAIYKAQQNIRHKATIDVPLLVLFSDKSVDEKQWSEKLQFADAVLSVKQIKTVAEKINGDVTTCEIKNALHDVVLSKKPFREKAYQKIFEWTAAKIT
jgi:alpha-beta hydrolase superfamily lysophospholipase